MSGGYTFLFDGAGSGGGGSAAVPENYISLSAAPIASDGEDGNFALDAATGNVYGPKAGGVWPGTPLGNVFNGKPNNFIALSANPVSSDGQDGNFAINGLTGALFGPKAGGTWPATSGNVLGAAGLAGVSLSTINGQEILTQIDGTRSNKVLSINETRHSFSNPTLSDLEWMSIGSADHAALGQIIRENGTIIASDFTTVGTTSTFSLDLYINGALNSSIHTGITGTNQKESIDTIDIDVSAGDIIQVRAARTSGSTDMDDTVISLITKWRV